MVASEVQHGYYREIKPKKTRHTQHLIELVAHCGHDRMCILRTAAAANLRVDRSQGVRIATADRRCWRAEEQLFRCHRSLPANDGVDGGGVVDSGRRRWRMCGCCTAVAGGGGGGALWCSVDGTLRAMLFSCVSERASASAESMYVQ